MGTIVAQGPDPGQVSERLEDGTEGQHAGEGGEEDEFDPTLDLVEGQKPQLAAVQGEIGVVSQVVAGPIRNGVGLAVGGPYGRTADSDGSIVDEDLSFPQGKPVPR